MEYIGDIFRPPSEARSLLVQVTVGCSHNRCTFCSMYARKKFHVKNWEKVQADLDEGLAQPYYDRLFLCDGDALVLSTDKLLRILRYVRDHGPHIKRVGVYGDARNVASKSVSELIELREAGLGIIYHGVESGDDEVLKRIDKGADSAAQLEAAVRVKAAGILYSAIVLLGVGGVELSERHAHKTAEFLSKADPDYLGLLMLRLVPGTPLFEDARSGRFVLPNKWGLLRELRIITAECNLTDCRYSANHASNYLPLTGKMPEDREKNYQSAGQGVRIEGRIAT